MDTSAVMNYITGEKLPLAELRWISGEEGQRKDVLWRRLHSKAPKRN